MSEFKLPDVGEGLTEAEIVSWKVKEGDEIQINDIVVEIETAKSLVELPSPFAGTVLSLMVPEGETVPVGTPIISIGDPAEASAAPAAPAPQTESDPYLGMAEKAGAEEAKQAEAMEIDLSNPAASGGGEGESLVGRNKADRGPVRRARKVSSGAAAAHWQTQAAFEPGASPMVEAEPAPEPVPAQPVAPAARTSTDVRVLAKPPVRKLAKDLGVDITALTPTGPHGTVSREDVEGAAAGTSYESAAPATLSYGVARGERERREPIKGVRKMM